MLKTYCTDHVCAYRFAASQRTFQCWITNGNIHCHLAMHNLLRLGTSTGGLNEIILALEPPLRPCFFHTPFLPYSFSLLSLSLILQLSSCIPYSYSVRPPHYPLRACLTTLYRRVYHPYYTLTRRAGKFILPIRKKGALAFARLFQNSSANYRSRDRL